MTPFQSIDILSGFISPNNSPLAKLEEELFDEKKTESFKL